MVMVKTSERRVHLSAMMTMLTMEMGAMEIAKKKLAGLAQVDLQQLVMYALKYAETDITLETLMTVSQALLVMIKTLLSTMDASIA